MSETQSLRVDPEMAVLSGLLYGLAHNAEWLIDNCDPAWFQTKASRSLFLVLSKEIPAGASASSVKPIVEAEAPESLALLDRLHSSTSMDLEAGPQALVKSLQAYAQTTRFKKAITTAELSLKNEVPYAEVRGTLERQLTQIDLSALSAKTYDDKRDMARRVQDYLENKEGKGLAFGLAKLDATVPPIMLGNLVIIAGRPGTGKSTHLRNWCRNWVKAGEHVAYFSFEMSGEEKLPLFACMDSGITYTKYVRNTMNEWDKSEFCKAVKWWVEAPNFVLNERSYVTPDWILRTMKLYRAQGVTTFILDHLHRVRYTANGKGEIRHAMGEFASTLKSFGVDYGCRVVAGAQFTKGDKHEEPGDEMIKEAGEIIHEADKIFLSFLPLVAGSKSPNGDFIPFIAENGRRLLANEAEKTMALGMDPTRAFLKVGKQRVRELDGILAFPFNPYTGVIADLDDHLGLRLAS